MDNRIPSFKDLEEDKPIVPRLPIGWKVLSPDKVVSPRGNPFSIKLDTTGNIQSYSSDKVTPSMPSFNAPQGSLKPLIPSNNQLATETASQTSMQSPLQQTSVYDPYFGYNQPIQPNKTISAEGLRPTGIQGKPDVGLFKQALPLVIKDNNADVMVEYFTQQPDVLRRNLITVGRNKVTEELFNTLYPQATEQEIEQYFNPKVPGLPVITGELPIKKFGDRIRELIINPTQVMPFISGTLEGLQMVNLVITAKKLQNNEEVGLAELRQLQDFVREANRDRTTGYSVVDGLIRMIPFAGELYITSGINAGTSASVSSYLKGLISSKGLQFLEGRIGNLVVSGVSNIAGSTVQAGITGVGRVPVSTIEKQLTSTLNGDEESVWESAVKSGFENWVEVLSERTGGIFTSLGNAAKGQLIKRGIFSWILKNNPSINPSKFQSIMKRSGWNGFVEEMLEERVGEATNGILAELGLSDQEFSIPTAKQLVTEFITFSIPGLTNVAISTGMSAIDMANQIQPMPALDENVSPNEQPKANITPEINTQLKSLGYTDDIIKDLDQAEVNSIIKNQTKWTFGKARVPSVQGVSEPSTTATPAITLYHGTTQDFPDADIIGGKKMYGIHLTTDSDVAKVYSGKSGSIKKYSLSSDSKILDLSDGETLWDYMVSQRILDTDDIDNIDLENYVKSGQLYQYDISSHTYLADDVAKTAKSQGYDVVKMIDKLGGGDDIAYVVVNKEKLQVSEAPQSTTEPVSEEVSTITPEEPISPVGESIKVGKDVFSIKETEDMLSYFGDYLSNPNVTQEYGLFKKMVSLQKKERMSNYQDIYNSLIDSGIDRTEADKVARSALKGAYKYEQTEMVNAVSENIIELMRGYIDYKFNVELQGKYPWERLSVIEALTKAASGKPIPSDRTKVTLGGSQLFPNGATELERLQFVFSGSMPKLIEGLKKSSDKKIPLGKFIEDGIFREIPEGGFKPQQIDEELAEYLRGLPEPPMPPFGQQQGQMFPEEYVPSDIKINDARTKIEKLIDMRKAGLLKTEPIDESMVEYLSSLSESFDQIKLGQTADKLTLELIENLSDMPTDLKVTDARSMLDKIIEMRKAGLLPVEPVVWQDFPEITRAVRQDPLMKDILTPKRYQALKDLGMGVLDILNGIRSIKASVDQSFALRQLFWIMPDIRQDMIDVMITSWKAGWSETAAKEAWTEITKKPWYPLHEKMVEKGHVDAFRRGGIEEFGFVGESERPISKAFAKLPTTQWSERNYVAGINAGIAFAYDRYYEAIMRDSQLIAEHKKDAPKNGFSIERDFGAMMDLTASLTGRAKLGDLKANSTTYQVLNAIFFSVRNKLGRFLTPVHMLGFNKLGKGAYFSPRLLRTTWKNMAIVVGVIGSIMALGEMAGWWDVEKDPNSADFGKIRIGKMRIDPWAGMQQVFVFFYRMASGKIKSTTTGETGKIDPADLISDTVEKSGSPALSLLLEARRGKTYSGEELSATDTGQWIDRLAPFLVSDIYNTLEEYPGDIGKAVTSGALGYLGAGVNTYGAETQTQQFTSKLGTEDAEGLQAEIDRLTKAGATQSKINEVKEKGKTYDITSLKKDLDKIINTFDEEALDKDPLARYYKDWNTQSDSYKSMSSKEQERYIESNTDFKVGRIFWGEESTISTIEQANALVDLANDYDIAPDMIPAFQLTDKGRERIPVNQDLWEGYFEYYDLPSSSYFAIEDEKVIQEYIDNGKLDAGMLKIWQQFRNAKTDTAKNALRKRYPNMSKGSWRDDYRRINQELNEWLIENKELSPLVKKKVTTSSSRAVSQGTTLSSTPSMGGISRSRKASYPKFKKPRLSMSINAPRVRGV